MTVQEAVQRLSPAPRVFGLSQLFEEVVVILAEVSGQYSAVEWCVQPDDLTVYTDRGILHQLLVKLLRLFLRRGEGSRQVSLRAFSDNAHVTIAVTSGAIRIQAGDEDLRLCQWLAQALHTEIHVEGEERGSRLSFVLPVGTRLRKVLIIDDELPAIELFQSYLNGLDYQVIGETMAEQALQRAVETQPDVIVLDVMMPAMDGWELLQRLYHTPQLRDVPIIVCSVLDDADLAFALGAARFLKKPVLRQQLVTALRETCPQAARSATEPPGSHSTASRSPSG